MEAQNWLCLYREISGIDRVMRGMHKRVGGENSMDKSADVLVQEYQTLEATFQAFWPELQLFAEESRAQLLQ
jgi:acyl carrier protein phosphodiesterase